MSPLLKIIFQQTYTVNDLHRRLRLMQECLEVTLYDAPEQIRVTPSSIKRKQFIQALNKQEDVVFFSALEESVWDSFTPITLANTMKLILDEASTLPVMTLYVPVAFTDKQLAPLSKWVRREVAANVMLDVLVDPKVVGGCAFVYKDTHFDWSLHRYLRAKRGMVNTLLNSYGH